MNEKLFWILVALCIITKIIRDRLFTKLKIDLKIDLNQMSLDEFADELKDAGKNGNLEAYYAWLLYYINIFLVILAIFYLFISMG